MPMFCRHLPCFVHSWDWYGSVLGNGSQPIQKQRIRNLPSLARSWDWYGSVLGNGSQPIQKQRIRNLTEGSTKL